MQIYARPNRGSGNEMTACTLCNPSVLQCSTVSTLNLGDLGNLEESILADWTGPCARHTLGQKSNFSITVDPFPPRWQAIIVVVRRAYRSPPHWHDIGREGKQAGGLDAVIQSDTNDLRISFASPLNQLN